MKKILDTQKVQTHELSDFIKKAHELDYSVEVEAISPVGGSIFKSNYMVSLVKFEEKTE